MFKSIKINNLRAITELEINNFGKVNLLVGPNNCGKTTILESIFFLVGATNPQLPINANNLRGLPFLSREVLATLWHNRDTSKNIKICAVTYEEKEEQSLSISPIRDNKQKTEFVSSDFVTIEGEVNGIESNFVPDGFRFEYKSSQVPDDLKISQVILRGNEIVTEGSKERSDRGYFISPSTLLTGAKDKFGAAQRNKQIPQLLSFLQKVDPDISDLRLNEIGLVEADIGLPGLMPVNLMGGGIGKCLSVALGMLYYRDGIVIIDEIENGLHHSIQKTLWNAVFSWAQDLNIQVFATTHSNECINAFKDSIDNTLFESEAKLFRIERKEEKFRAVEYTKDMLAESIESKWEVR